MNLVRTVSLALGSPGRRSHARRTRTKRSATTGVTRTRSTPGRRSGSSPSLTTNGATRTTGRRRTKSGRAPSTSGWARNRNGWGPSSFGRNRNTTGSAPSRSGPAGSGRPNTSGSRSPSFRTTFPGAPLCRERAARGPGGSLSLNYPGKSQPTVRSAGPCWSLATALPSSFGNPGPSYFRTG